MCLSGFPLSIHSAFSTRRSLVQPAQREGSFVALLGVWRLHVARNCCAWERSYFSTISYSIMYLFISVWTYRYLHVYFSAALFIAVPKFFCQKEFPRGSCIAFTHPHGVLGFSFCFSEDILTSWHCGMLQAPPVHSPPRSWNQPLLQEPWVLTEY